MKLRELLQRLEYQTALPDLEITGVTSDSRQVREGYLFVAIKGGRFDGHDHAAQAVQNGAAAVVCQHDVGLACQVLVPDSRYAYGILAANWFGNPAGELKLVAVTGTNGKTTTTYLMRHILEKTGHPTGLIGTIHNEIGAITIPARHTTPDPMQLHSMLRRMKQAGCEYVVLEASSHAIDQNRLAGCSFECGIFTNLTQDHLDYHKTMENYFAAKRKLFYSCKSAVFNLDDAYGRRLAEDPEFAGKGRTFSLELDEADYTAKNIEYAAAYSRFAFVGSQQIVRVKLPMPGRFSVANAMGAMAACLQLGLELEEIAAALADCTGVPGRAEVLPTDTDYTIIRDYAHTPDGLEKILLALRTFAKGRIVTLFGCAGNRDRAKRPQMAQMAAKYSDFVILTSDNPRDEDPMQIIEDALPGILAENTPYQVIPDRYAAIEWGIDNARKDDILLLAGKGHEDYQVLDFGTIFFDEKVIVDEILSARRAAKSLEESGK